MELTSDNADHAGVSSPSTRLILAHTGSEVSPELNKLSEIFNVIYSNADEETLNRPQLISELETEFSCYERKARIALTADLFNYWEANKSSFPYLYSIFFDTISCPITEVSVECLFSHLNFVFNRYRTQTKSEFIENILFLRLNEKFT